MIDAAKCYKCPMSLNGVTPFEYDGHLFCTGDCVEEYKKIYTNWIDLAHEGRKEYAESNTR
jgi:hypothetical protein